MAPCCDAAHIGSRSDIQHEGLRGMEAAFAPPVRGRGTCRGRGRGRGRAGGRGLAAGLVVQPPMRGRGRGRGRAIGRGGG
jgi:hypothetical protein